MTRANTTTINDIAATELSILLLLAVSFLLLIACPAEAQNSRGPAKLPEQAHGEAAIQALAEKLPEVAKLHGITAEELKKKFREDSTLYVDENARLLYIEEQVKLEADTSHQTNTPALAEGILPQDAFLLNSKPGSTKTIFLDFDGHIVSGTAWNSRLGSDPYHAQPFDLDGSPASFNDTERNRIIDIWARVAEDFAPFDVNVTTEDPGDAALNRSSSTDQVYGSRALIVPTAPVCSSCGGVAYVGIFDHTSPYYDPAWVLANSLGGGHDKYTAEAISHEVGHNLGLYHDGKTDGTEYYSGHGSGVTGWAPIMGVGYYKNLSQWSKGEYSLANNTNDDYARMSSNGLNFRADDHGNSRSSASVTHQQDTTFTASGIIEEPADIDFFSFSSGSGEVLIDVDPKDKGPNLDVKLAVYNSAGELLGQSNPADLLYASIAVALPAEGTYYLSVEGIGKGEPATGYSDYGSLGQYTIFGTTTNSNNQPPVAVAEASMLSGMEPLTVTFSAANSSDPDGTIQSYSWDFGDGATANGVSAQNTFSAGTYNVTLTVVDDAGFSDSDSLTIIVASAPNVAPNASASYSAPNPIIAGKDSVNFSSAGSSDSDGTIVSYRWEFGDGSSANSANPSHVYAAPGKYTATLTVTDDEGAADSDSVALNVESDPNFIAAPSSLATLVSGKTITLSWNDNSDNETGFRIESAVKVKGKYVYSTLATTAADANSHSISGLSDGTYRFRVIAFHAGGESTPSNIAEAKVSTRTTGKPPKKK